MTVSLIQQATELPYINRPLSCLAHLAKQSTILQWNDCPIGQTIYHSTME